MAHIIIVWGLWGPYHCGRFVALRDYAAQNGDQVTGVSLFEGSRINQWRMDVLPKGVVHINLGQDEIKMPMLGLKQLLTLPKKLGAEVALLPAYWHWSLVLNAGVRLAGGRVVMMNETHEGTARARGLKAAFKQRVVAGFHAGFVGGAPQKRYFSSLGLPAEKIVTGYDAVDNDYFAGRSDVVRRRKEEFRARFALPERYFLSLGRLVAKKNLDGLLKGYRHFLDKNPDTQNHLVLVGAGEDEPKLRHLCANLGLTIYEKKHVTGARLTNGDLSFRENQSRPGVHFYGFRKLKENPVFYGLADGFILPSLYEEWGLVVNEAMAAGLPVIVSETAGSAEDLLEKIPASQGKPVNEKMRCNGMVFNPLSSTELAMALDQLAAKASLRQQMGKESRRIIEKFSCRNFAINAVQAARLAVQ
jgi:glycosyltransferase involved in cell wall biosynthesis